MKSGSIMMSQQRAEEVVFILEKLKNLEVYPELLNEIVQEDTSKLQSSEDKTNKSKIEARNE